jgi:hypothetical protein
MQIRRSDRAQNGDGTDVKIVCLQHLIAAIIFLLLEKPILSKLLPKYAKERNIIIDTYKEKDLFYLYFIINGVFSN